MKLVMCAYLVNLKLLTGIDLSSSREILEDALAEGKRNNHIYP